MAVALVNNAVQQAYFIDMGIDTRIINLDQKVTEIVKVLKNINALVIIGSLDEKNKETLIEIDDMLKLMDAATYAGVKRFIYLSTFETREIPLYFRPIFIQNHYIEKWLKISRCHYTIIHAGTLVDKKGTGLVEVGPNIQHREIAKEDVAKFILACLESDATICKEIKVVSGKIPIQQVISSI